MRLASHAGIPVLVGDDYVKPFPSLLDWPSLAFEFCASCVDAIVPTLRAVPIEEAEAMRARVVAAHARYLATPQRKWQGVLTLLLQRLDYRALA